MGEPKLGDCFLRRGVVRMSKPTVRKEERELFILEYRTLAGTIGANTGTTGAPRPKREKAEKDARKRPTGTTGLGPVLPVEGRYHRQCKISQNMSSAGFLPAGTTGGSRYHRSKPGTTGSSISRKTQERSWHCRYHRP